MKKTFYFAILLLFAASCTQTARVEVGLNDDPNYTDAVPGDLSIRVLAVEIGAGSEYTAIWEGSSIVTVPLTSQEFFSITNEYVDVNAGSYNRIRIMVDSIAYATETSSSLVLDTNYQFIATSFSDIVIEDGTELRIVVDLASANWFDSGAQTIISGHNPFEGATFRESY